MAQRKLQEVDASSIADVAFILLAFIIVITTLQKEEGIPAVLPQKNTNDETPPVITRERNILKILVNSQDQLMIEDQWDKSLDDIKDVVIEFMTNPANVENMPEMVEINEQLCLGNLQALKQQAQEGTTNVSGKIADWEGKLEAVKLLGTFKTLPKSATIAIQYDKGTTYGTYLGVRDRVMSGINELRNQKSKEKFGISYNELEAIREEVKTDEDKARIKAIREVYPQKIVKLPARNVQ